MSRLSKVQLGEVIDELKLEIKSLTDDLAIKDLKIKSLTEGLSSKHHVDTYAGIIYGVGMWRYGGKGFKTLQQAKDFKNGK